MLLRCFGLIVAVGALATVVVERCAGQERHVLSHEKNSPLDLRSSPNGQWLAMVQTVGADAAPEVAPEPGERRLSKVTLWDVTTRQAARTLWGQAIGDASYHCRSLAFSPDGSRLALAEAYGRVRMWDTSTWEESTLAVPTSVPRKESGRKSRHPLCGELVFSADGRTLAVCYGTTTGNPRDHGVVRLWDPTTYGVSAVLEVEGRPQHVSFLPEARLGVVVLRSFGKKPYRELQIWSTESFARLERYQLTNDTAYGRFSPDGSLLAMVQHDQIVLYDTRSGRPMLLGSYGHFHGYPPRAGFTYRVGVSALGFSADGQVLATGGDFDQPHARVKLWDVASSGRAAPERLLDHGSGHVVVGLEYSPDGRHLATIVPQTAGTGAKIFLWELKDD